MTPQNIQNLLDNWIGIDYFLNVPTHQKPTFPPYDIIKNGDDYDIILALAGYSSTDINITHVDDVLIVETNKRTVGNEVTKDTEYLHKGIAKRAFKLSFNLSPEIKIDKSKLIDGMLTISMHREIPETKRPKQIMISTS